LTSAPEKKKIKAEGQTTFPFESFWKTYGLVYKKMELNDKYVMCSLIIDGYALEIFEKGLYLLEKSRVLKIYIRIRSG